MLGEGRTVEGEGGVCREQGRCCGSGKIVVGGEMCCASGGTLREGKAVEGAEMMR